MKNLLFALLGTSLIVGCSSTELAPGAHKVIVSPNKPPKGCKFLGRIVGNQGNFFTGAYTSNKNMETGAMNDLQNQAHELGANYVQLINSRAGNTGNGTGTFNGFQQTNVTTVGNGYRCKNLSIED
jgi:uncharacterized protein YbjQ (UPF0145 family)